MTLQEYFIQNYDIKLHNDAMGVCRYCVEAIRSRGEIFPTIDGLSIEFDEAEENGFYCYFCGEIDDLEIAL